ncbi:MAG: hypothetical protein U5K28_10205 [Halobacteriales archaeon]|nr:hypothetical protein [Halobacteriales archaeon]
MRRRQFLASGTALLSVPLAGCGHPSVVLDLETASSDDIVDEVSMTVDPGSEEYRVVSSAIENGSSTRSGRYDLFDRVNTVRFEDSFYEVSETRLDSADVTVYTVRLDFDPANSTPDLGAIAYEALPETDRQRLQRVLAEDVPDQAGYDVGVEYGTAGEVGEDSVFVPEQQYDILTDGADRYRVAVEARTTSEAAYQYEVTELAPDVATFATHVREQYLFALVGLSDAERAVVEEAIESAYFEDDEAFRSVVETIRAHDGLTVDDFYGTWLLAYDGTDYLTYVEW